MEVTKRSMYSTKTAGEFKKLVPINVVAFDDGAEVFKSTSMNYSNNSRTEEIQNISEKYRRRIEFASFLGGTSGSGHHPNTQEKHTWYTAT